jgi:peptide/nickel transport system substrate-binding protein
MAAMPFGAQTQTSLGKSLPEKEAGAARSGGTLAFSVTVGEPSNYDGHASTSISVLHRLAPHYSTLVKISQSRYPEIVGDAAESWQVSDDGLSYRFVLWPDIRFHDGSVLRSDDVVASYSRIVTPPNGVVSAREQLYQDIAAIEALDERTVVFRLARQNAAMMTLFASPWNFLYSARKLADDPRFPERNVLGTGPFRFVRHIAGSEWVGIRFNEYFRRGRPYLDGFRVLSMEQPAAVSAMSGGQLHTDFRGFSVQERDTILGARGSAMRTGDAEQPSFLALTFNAARPPFDDTRVRLALHISLDRWGGSTGLQRTSIYNSVGGLQRNGAPFAGRRDEILALPGFGLDMQANRDRARRLLAEAGQSSLKINLTSRRDYLPLALFMIDQWRQIGVAAEQDVLDNTRFFARLASGVFDVTIDGTVDYVDEPILQLQSYQSFDVNRNNRTRAIDRTVDDLYERQIRARDSVERRQLVRALEAHLMAQAYRVPLFWGKRYMVAATEMRGYNLDNPSTLIGQDLSDVWLDAPQR